MKFNSLFSKITLWTLILYSCSETVSAQSYFSLNVDNDLYFYRDYFYSSGIFLQYGYQKKQDTELEDDFSEKQYILWELGQEIYSPSFRFTKNTAVFDYPYGGWSYGKVTFQKEKSIKKQWQWGAQLGFTGDASGAQWLQNTYHRLFLNLPDLTWEDEVPQALHLNIFADYFYRWHLFKKVALQSHLFSKIGTQQISSGGSIGFIFNNQNVLPKGGNILQDKRDGIGFYLGVRIQHIIHDYMLSGSLFNDSAPFTVPINPVRATLEAGFAFCKKSWRFSTTYYHRSPDNKIQAQKAHHYLNITISRFFDSPKEK